MVQSTDILKVSTLKNHWKIVLISLAIITIAIIAVAWLVFSETEESHVISGVLFIDGQVAPEGVNVTIMFDTFSLYDIDGTDNKGRYQIEVSDFLGLTGTFVIYYNGIEYTANDQFGVGKIIQLSDEVILEPVNLYISINDDTSEPDDSTDGDDSDGEDETNDDTNDGSNDDSDTDDDQNEDDSDDGGDSGEGDDVDDDTQNDEDDDDSDEEDIVDISIDKKIWHELSDEWVSDIALPLDDVIYYNLTLENTGNRNLTNVTIYDNLPEDMQYLGNAMIDNENKEPYYNHSSNSLTWNISNFKENQIMFISYNCSVASRGSYENDVTVTGQYNQEEITDDSTAKVNIQGNITVNKTVWNENLQQWSDNITIEQYEQIKANISIKYNGSFELRIFNITDILPQGMNYSGNATVNDVAHEPVIDEENHSIIWEEIIVSSNEKVFIEFDLDVTQNKTLENIVFVAAKESIGTIFEKSDNFTVTAVTPKAINVSKKVRNEDQIWLDTVDAEVCDKVQFNITITNIGRSKIDDLNIIDILPTNLVYSNNSCYIVYENEIFYRKPHYYESNNTLHWNNLTYLIHNHLRPNSSFSIFYNVTVVGSGTLKNNVTVTSPTCSSCQYLSGSAHATVNATQPVDELFVSINGPFYKYVNEQIRIQASATGGTSPYSYLWDLNDDGVFDDETGPIIFHSWNLPDNYTIYVKVIDTANQTKTNSTFVNITIQPLEVDAGGPYQGYNDSTIYFNGVANGGIGNYTWYWDFGDGTNSTLKSPNHIYSTVGQYNITLIVHDEQNQSANDTAIVTVIQRDNQPPYIELEKPINAIYIKNRAIFPFINPIIIGSINITYSATDNETEIIRMELYINDELVQTIYDSSGVYTWDDRIFRKCSLKIKAIDSSGNSNTLEKMVWKLF